MIAIKPGAGTLSSRLYAHYRELILAGSLREGDRLPASRVLADELGVSRNTVLEAYDQLGAEGFVIARRGAGVFVDSIDEADRRGTAGSAVRRVPLSKLAKRVSKIPQAYLRRNARQGVRYEFLYGEPSYEDFPQEAWARTLGKIARQLPARHLSYPGFQGLAELRASLAAYLGRARGIRCSADNIIVVHGTQEAIELAGKLFINEGDPVVCEHPSYRGFIKVSRASGARIHYVDVDASGIIAEQLPEAARLAFVTPSHQFPTGSVMSIGRRLALLDWARKKRAMVFEDDYDGEFRYTSSPVASLKSLDETGSVMYVGTVSKTFFPALRIGWMVVPDYLMDAILDLRALSDTTPPAMEQLALADFIDSGQFERHIFRTRKRYADKRGVLLAELENRLGSTVDIRGSEAGIHVLLSIPKLKQDKTEALQARCLRRGVSVNSASPFYRKSPDHVELVIGYNAVASRDIRAGARILAEEILALVPGAG